MKAVVYFLSSAAVLAVLAIPGCGKQRPGYHIVMINRTHRDLYGVAVYFDGKMAAEKGYTAKGGLASYGFVFLPIPDDAEVRWIDEAKNPSSKPQIAKNDYTPEAVDRLKRWIDQGEHHSPRVKLTGIVPEDPAYEYLFHHRGGWHRHRQVCAVRRPRGQYGGKKRHREAQGKGQVMRYRS